MKVKLHDVMFSHEIDPGRIGPGGYGTPPFSWDRGDVSSRSEFVTDSHMGTNISFSGYENTVALVLEPEVTKQSNVYDVIENDDSDYDYILTHDDQLLTNPKSLPCPAIQYHVSDFSAPNKDRLTSMISSDKNYAPGHQIRHDVISTLSSKGLFDLYGRGFDEIETKEEGLRPYYFSIAIENSKSDWYFTEKILDCFATRTVPVYWGCPKIGDHFDSRGIISFNSVEELGKILGKLSRKRYNEMLEAVERNHQLVCNEYASAEGWIYEKYPFLF